MLSRKKLELGQKDESLSSLGDVYSGPLFEKVRPITVFGIAIVVDEERGRLLHWAQTHI
jgi:hypothetical protein